MTRLTKNGHVQYSVADQQWQSLHMSAAAGCRGSTALGGHGPTFNSVLSRTEGHTCEQVCAATKYYTECDASLSFMGLMGRMVNHNSAAAYYYNYGCKSPGYSRLPHETTGADDDVIHMGSAYGFCCCRKP